MSTIFIIQPATTSTVEQAVEAIYEHQPAIVTVVREDLVLATMPDKNAGEVAQDPRIGAVTRSPVQTRQSAPYARCSHCR